MPLRYPHSGRPRHARLGLEALEDRTALAGGLTAAALPNDVRFDEQWGLRNVGQNAGRAGADLDAAKAWDVTTGSTRLVVAVNDTGIDYTHPDLHLNIWLNQGEVPASRRENLLDLDGDGLITFRDLNDRRNQGHGKITDLNGNGRIDGGDLLRPMVKDARGNDTGNGGWADGRSNDGDRFVDDLVGWDFVNNDNNPMDDFGHGTHVAGTIGAVGGNGLGVSGLNWKVQLMGIKFLDGAGNGSLSGLIAGLNYAVAKGAKISNNSWTGAGLSEGLEDAVANARSRGHIVVAAAGNAGLNNDVYPDYPSSLGLSNVVSVAATDRHDRLASFSNYGSSVDLAAPGVDILSTGLHGGYAVNNGTSMATPHVTGTLALVWADNPSWGFQQVIDQVLNTAEKLPALAGKTRTGGRVNAAAAVGAAQVSAVAPRVVAAVPRGASPAVVSSVRVTFDKPMALSSFTPADVALKGPGGKPVAVTNIKAVDGTGGKAFDIVFGAQTTLGTYTIKIGPNVTDLAGNRMSAYQTTFSVKPAPALPAVGPKVVSAVRQGSPAAMTAVRVTFDKAVALSSFTAADVTLTGPGGRAVAITGVRVVSGTGDRTFDIFFAVQKVAGSYALKLGPNVTDVKGARMTAYQTTVSVSAPAPVGPKVVSAAPKGPSAGVVSSVRVTFDKAVAPSSFTAADVSLTGPGGRAVAITGVKLVAGSGDRGFDITFAAQSVAGSYTLKVGPNVTDPRGVRMPSYQTAFQVTAAPVSPAVGPKVVSAVRQGAAGVMTSVRVTFDKAVKLSSFTATKVTLTGPGGRAVAITGVKAVAGTGERVFDITFAAQRIVGAYTLKIGPNVTDVKGVPAKAYQATLSLPGPATNTTGPRTYTQAADVSVPQGGRVVSLLSVTDSFTIADVNVKVNVSHPAVSDLYVALQAPDGTMVPLFNRMGHGSSDLANTVFDDSASLHIGLGFGPFTGSFQPVVPLASLNGKGVKGAWKLWVEDRGGHARGALLDWSITARPRA